MSLPSDTDSSQPSVYPRPASQPQSASHGRNLAETGPADGFLFPPDDLIRSVLDLTRELESLGVIEIHVQPSGAQFYRIIRAQPVSRRTKQPRSETAHRVAVIFRRRRSTLWSVEELKAFSALQIDPDDLSAVEEYYRSEAGKEKSYCRTSLLTFLRHYPGEVDKARRWKETSTRKHCY